MEALLGIGQVHMEEARVAANILIQPLDDIDSEAFKNMNQEELDDMTKSQGKDANAKLRTALESVRAHSVAHQHIGRLAPVLLIVMPRCT